MIALSPRRAPTRGEPSSPAQYLDHLPLARQLRIMKRQGLEVSSQTLWKQLDVITRDL